ncbi:hypothetical protein MHUMG1_07192 [Metarhizium humberi]|uniref:Uncharacterized protein n=1 Tax=Metarhizium humberi TaxID=2596975 RepID=A0A9P8MA91_9HYPO|nr:hypothetical protein MHUMG1_07192 [Metarhizium humberi]
MGGGNRPVNAPNPIPPPATAGPHGTNAGGQSMPSAIPRSAVRPGMGGAGPIPTQQYPMRQQDQFPQQQQQQHQYPQMQQQPGMGQVPLQNVSQGQAYQGQPSHFQQRPNQQEQHMNQQAPRHRKREPWDGVVDLRNENMFEDDARHKLSSYVVWRMEKAQRPNATDELGYPCLPTWECATHREERDISQQAAALRVYELDREGDRVMLKKKKLPEVVQQQIERAQQKLQDREDDDRYEYHLAQLESKVTRINESHPLYHVHTSRSEKYRNDRHRNEGHRRSREYRSDKAYQGDKKKQDKKYERASVTAYFVRVPKRNEDVIEMLKEERMPKRQSSTARGHGQQHHMPMGNMTDAYTVQQEQPRMNMPPAQQHTNANPAMPQQFRPAAQQQQPQPQQQQQHHHQPQTQPQPRPPQHPQQQQSSPFRQQPPPPPPPPPFPPQGQQFPRPPAAPQPQVNQQPPSRPMPPQVPPHMPPQMPPQQQQHPQQQRPSPPVPQIPRNLNRAPGPGHQSRPNTPHNPRSFTPNRDIRPGGKQRAHQAYVKSPPSSRSSRDSVTSFESGYSSDEGGYTTPQSSVASGSRHHRTRRSPSKPRHGRRDRPEHFGVDSPPQRQHSKQHKDHAMPPSPPSTSSSSRQPAFEYCQRWYQMGKEDGMQQSRPVVVQPPSPRAVPPHRVRQAVHREQLDDLAYDLEQVRIADHLRGERNYKRDRDPYYHSAEDDFYGGKRYPSRASRRDIVDDEYDDDFGERRGTRCASRMSRRDIVDDVYEDDDRWASPTARYNPMMSTGGYRPTTRPY